MEKIICFINMFAAEAKVYRLDEDNNQDLINTIPVEKLSAGLAIISANSKINHITLIGAPTYADAIVPEIIEYAKTNFNNNDLIVEVMR
jgi:hypothetical protein